MSTLKYALQVWAVWAVWLTALAIGVSPWLLALRLAGITGRARADRGLKEWRDGPGPHPGPGCCP